MRALIGDLDVESVTDVVGVVVTILALVLLLRIDAEKAENGSTSVRLVLGAAVATVLTLTIVAGRFVLMT